MSLSTWDALPPHCPEPQRGPWGPVAITPVTAQPGPLSSSFPFAAGGTGLPGYPPPSPLSRDVVTALETQKLPIRGLDRIRTLGLCQLRILPDWGVYRERWEGAV